MMGVQDAKTSQVQSDGRERVMEEVGNMWMNGR